MRRVLIALASLSLLGGPASSQVPSPPPLPKSVPKTAPTPAAPIIVKVKSPALAKLQGPTTGETTWVYDVRHFPPDQVEHNRAEHRLVMSGVGGPHLVVCVSYAPTSGFSQQPYLVTFEGGPSPPPGPDPPTPPPPSPDGLTKELKDAFDKDFKAGVAKAAEFRNVGLIFGEAGKFLGLASTTGDVLKLLALALDTSVTDGHMPTVKVIVARQLAKVASGQSVPLTETHRAAFRVTFAELAKAIEEAQK